MSRGSCGARVFINGRFLSQPREGVQRAAEEVVRAVDALLDEGAIDVARWRVTVLAPRNAERELELRRIEVRRVGRLRGHAWEQLELPWHARGGALLSLANAAPVLKRRHLATLHDAAVFAAPAGYSWLFATWYRVLFTSLGRTAGTILTASEFSRAELRRHARIPNGKVKVVPLGAEHLGQIEADRSVLERHGLRGRRFVLAVGSLNPNKNFAAVLAAMRAYGEPRPTLVVAGGINPRVFRADSSTLELEGAVYVGYVSDAQLKALYEEAAVFVFPTLYEGFGLPPLEAMTCGCPALVSDLPVLREVCGDGAAYFQPRDPLDIARAIREVLEDGDHAAALRARGYRRAEKLTWKRCATEIWEVLASRMAGAE